MKLERLKLENWRNHELQDLTFKTDGPVYFVGPNALGKTNILEAIYLLALTKSFRTNTQQDTIGWGKEYCRVTGQFAAGRGEQNARSSRPLTLEVFFGNPPQPLKSLRLNGVKTSAVKFIGNCQIVFFHPEDLNMLYLGPDLRRRYLDILNIQVNRKYYAALRSFRRVMAQRNALLRRINEGLGAPADMDIWGEQLVEHGEVLIAERAKTIDYINERLSEVYSAISEKNDEVRVRYAASVSAGGFAEKLRQNLDRDLAAQFTLSGPHRDDMEFFLNGKPIQVHASRGEYRSLLLALKLLEVEFYQEKSGEKPLFLLDDVFSELDLNRQKMLLKAIEGHQAIISTTHLDEVVAERTHKGLQINKKGLQFIAG